MARRTLPVETGVEETGQIAERSAILVGLTGADTPVVGPHRDSWIRGLHPLPLLDDSRIGFSKDSSHFVERLATPVAHLFDPLVHHFQKHSSCRLPPLSSIDSRMQMLRSFPHRFQFERVESLGVGDQFDASDAAFAHGETEHRHGSATD